MLSLPGTIVLVAVGILLIATRYLARRFTHRRQAKALSCKPPRATVPAGIFGINSFCDLKKAGQEKRFVGRIRELHDEYGTTYLMNILGTNCIFTIEPENIKAVLATQFNDFSFGRRHEVFAPLLGDGIFTLDGAGWSHSRALLRPQFTRDQVSDLDQMDIHVERLIQAVPKDGTPFDIQELFFRLTLDSATDFLFGESVESLVSATSNQIGISEKSVEGKQGFADAFNYSQDVLAQRGRAQGFYWLINSKEFREANRLVHQFVDYYVDKAIRYVESGNAKVPNEQGRYVFLEALALQTKDRKVLRDQMLNILLAGRDTTSSLLSSVFYFLARNKRAWDTLREEIVERFGTDAEKGADINFHSMKDLPYLRYVVNEALRLLPPVPANGRTAIRDTTLPVGGGPDGRSPIFIPKGTVIRYVVWALHTRRDIWGADAEEFRPERWAEFTPKGWEYLPFNGGPRICLGQQYALTEASYVIIKLLQRFQTLENADPGPDRGSRPIMNHTLTQAHDKGVHVRLYAAN
ncbi:hypothetical protein DTO271D3_7855 [Paecilomyces variotii]|nr:hypothetical protein DTO271D3_7855 [Paecilomyces variotii]